MKNILLLNGPPACGKDTIAVYLEDKGFAHFKLKTALVADTATMYGVDFDLFNQAQENRLTKDAVLPSIGMSPREMLIHTSENVMKPMHGKSVYGKKLANKIKSHDNKNIVLSDCGFQEELEALYEELGDGSKIVVVQIHRDSCDFSKDSRSYVALDKGKYPNSDVFEIENNGTLDSTYLSIENIIKTFK